MRCVNSRAGLAVCLSTINIPKLCNQEKGCKNKAGALGAVPVCVHILIYVYAYMLMWVGMVLSMS